MFGNLKNRINNFIGKVEESAKHEVKVSTTTKIKSIASSKIQLTESDLEDVMWDLNMDLLQSDVAVETGEYLTTELKKRLLSKEIEKSKVRSSVTDTFREILFEMMDTHGFNLKKEIEESDKPYIILFLGVNGAGKTTTMSKMAHNLMNDGFSVVMAAGDTFRAGAIEQLETHAKRLGVKVISHHKGGDSAAVIFDAVDHARAKNIDVVLADTAGRMQTNTNLMDELRKVVSVNKPNLKVFVGDSLTGNDAVEQAGTFNEIVNIDASILTKMDADSRGGSALSIVHETGKPIIYVGVGQTYDDLKPFDPEWFINQLF